MKKLMLFGAVLLLCGACAAQNRPKPGNWSHPEATEFGQQDTWDADKAKVLFRARIREMQDCVSDIVEAKIKVGALDTRKQFQNTDWSTFESDFNRCLIGRGWNLK